MVRVQKLRHGCLTPSSSPCIPIPPSHPTGGPCCILSPLSQTQGSYQWRRHGVGRQKCCKATIPRDAYIEGAEGRALIRPRTRIYRYRYTCTEQVGMVPMQRACRNVTSAPPLPPPRLKQLTQFMSAWCQYQVPNGTPCGHALMRSLSLRLLLR